MKHILILCGGILAWIISIWSMIQLIEGHQTKPQPASVHTQQCPPADCSSWESVNKHLADRLAACWVCCEDVKQEGRVKREKANER